MPLDLSLVWAIEPLTFEHLLKQPEAARGAPRAEGGSPREDSDGVAVISIQGALTKNRSWFTDATGGYATTDIKQAVEAAADDDSIKSILLKIDSPGGTVDGTASLADAVAAAKAKKPVVAQVSGMAASAAYWIASQADKVFAHRSDMIGSIGTRMMLYDFHRLYEAAGVEAVPIDTGKFKSAGAQGTEITQEQRDNFQHLVDSLNAEFLSSVSAGRSMPMDQLKAVADGSVFVAKEAKKSGLIDGVQEYSKTLADMKKSRPKQAGAKVMSEPLEPVAATYEQLVASCPGAEPAFICGQLAAKATIPQATSAFMKAQAEAIATAKAEAAEAKKQADEAKAAAAKPGVTPVTTTAKATTGEDGDPIAEFTSRVDAKVKAGMNKTRATAAVVASDPDLHAEYVAAVNANRKPSRRAG